jgi:glycosyltransferase involved in cell wall biosynthesis
MDLAKAWTEVATALPDATLAIVGGGPLQAALEAALPPRARALGPQPLAAIPTWLAACDVLVLPSHVEGTPNAVLEALACGRRVVASAVGGVPDLITSSVLGTLVPARTPDALAAALTQALRTPYAPEAVAELGAHGGWEASAAALHAVLAAAADASVRNTR